MAENVALAKKKQKSFNKKVKNYKSLLTKGEIKIAAKPPQKTVRRERGLVYLGNIPHGFYEVELKEYFEQFGFVTRLRLARSKKTGKGRGFAFIEFRVPEVAKIVAETMDRYLMGKRLLKAQYIPPDKQHGKYFIGKAFTATSFPAKTNRKKQINSINKSMNAARHAALVQRLLNHVRKITKRLAKRGIEYNFKCVDVPKDLKTATDVPDSDAPSEASDSDAEIVFQPPTQRKVVKMKASELKIKKHTGKIEKSTKRKAKKPKSPKNATKKLGMIKNAALNSSQVKLTVFKKK